MRYLLLALTLLCTSVQADNKPYLSMGIVDQNWACCNDNTNGGILMGIPMGDGHFYTEALFTTNAISGSAGLRGHINKDDHWSLGMVGAISDKAEGFKGMGLQAGYDYTLQKNRFVFIRYQYLWGDVDRQGNGTSTTTTTTTTRTYRPKPPKKTTTTVVTKTDYPGVIEESETEVGVLYIGYGVSF